MMTAGNRYWSIDLPGLGPEQAQELIELAEQAGMLSWGGSIVDPGQFLTFHLDRDSVDGLYRALAFAQANRKSSAEADFPEISAILEEMKEWLDSTTVDGQGSASDH
jgi:hypothetical protein